MPDQLRANQSEPPREAAIEEAALVAPLLERISELEEENANLRRLEETIQANNHLFDALLRSIHEGIMLLNPRRVIVRLIHSMLGHAEKDVRGHSVLAYIHPEDVSRFEHTCESVLDGQAKVAAVEIRALGPGGGWIWVEAQMTDLLDDPHVQAIVVSWRRVPEPKI